MPRYKLARSAKRNLQEISDYWTERAGADIALKIVTGIVETIIALSTQPRMGVAAYQFGTGVRKFPQGNHMIYYRTSRFRNIEVLHVFHGSREQQKAWTEEPE